MQKGLFSIAGLLFVILIALSMVAYVKTTNSSILNLENDLLEIEHLQFSRAMLEHATDKLIKNTISSKALLLGCNEELIKSEVANSLTNFFNSISSDNKFPQYSFYIRQRPAEIQSPISAIINYIKVIPELVGAYNQDKTFTFSFVGWQIAGSAEAIGKISGRKYYTYFKLPQGYTIGATSGCKDGIVNVKM